MNNAKHPLKIFLARIAAVVLTGCSDAPMESSFSFEDSYQEIRERIIVDFSENPAEAEKRYSFVFSQPTRPDAKDLVAKAVVCGQLTSKGMKVHDSCQNILDRGSRSENDDVRSLAISALAFAMNKPSQDALVMALSDNSTIVRLEAAQALICQLDTLSADPNNPAASSQLKENLLRTCRTHHDLGESSFMELCRKAE